jgi:predicted kinase
MARVHLIIGPVGSGKSTFGLQLAQEQRAVRLTLDEWFSRLFSRDRPDTGVPTWYRERAARCIEQLWAVATQVLHAGVDVVLELGLLQRDERARFYERLDAAGLAHTVYVVDAPKEERWARVERRNAERGPTFSMEVTRPVFDFASALWEPPDDEERSEREVR